MAWLKLKKPQVHVDHKLTGSLEKFHLIKRTHNATFIHCQQCLFHLWQFTCRRAQGDPWCSKCLPRPPQSSALPAAGWPSPLGRLRSATNRQGHWPVVGTVTGKPSYDTTTEQAGSTCRIQTLGRASQNNSAWCISRLSEVSSSWGTVSNWAWLLQKKMDLWLFLLTVPSVMWLNVGGERKKSRSVKSAVLVC